MLKSGDRVLVTLGGYRVCGEVQPTPADWHRDTRMRGVLVRFDRPVPMMRAWGNGRTEHIRIGEDFCWLADVRAL